MDKFGRKLLCFFSGVLATFDTLVLILSVNTALLYVGAILIGIATGFFYAASWALGTTPRRH
jgi:MFS family permease